MGLLDISLFFLCLTQLFDNFSHANAEREVTDNKFKERLVLEGEVDVYAEIRALKEQIQNLTTLLHKGKIPASESKLVWITGLPWTGAKFYRVGFHHIRKTSGDESHRIPRL